MEIVTMYAMMAMIKLSKAIAGINANGGGFGSGILERKKSVKVQ